MARPAGHADRTSDLAVEWLGAPSEAEIREQGFADFLDLWDRMPTDIRNRIRTVVIDNPAE